MYYALKIFQAAGLTIILVGFLSKFPDVMDRKVLGTGIVFFTVGWLLERFLLKR